MATHDHNHESWIPHSQVPQIPAGECMRALVHLRAKLKWEVAKEPCMASSLMEIQARLAL